MVNRTLARRYAIAAIGVAGERGAVKRVGADLAAVAQAIGPYGLVHDFFVAPVIGRPEKERVLTEVFEKLIDPVSLHTLLLLVRKRREALLQPIAREYAKLAREAAGKEPLEIVSARDLGSNELDTIVTRLSQKYGKAFDVTQRTDPSLLGGVRITMGDRRIDGSLAGRLDELSRELFVRN